MKKMTPVKLMQKAFRPFFWATRSTSLRLTLLYTV